MTGDVEPKMIPPSGPAPQEALREQERFTVSFDREKLLALRDVAPEGAQEVIDVMLRLPEQMHFQPGATLVVGENGAGKSTFAKAVYFARRMEENRLNGGDGTLDSLNAGFSDDVALLHGSGPLTVGLAEAIKLPDLPGNSSGNNYTDYVDYGSLHGRGAGALGTGEKQKRSGFSGVDKEGRTTFINGTASGVPRFTDKDDLSMLGLPTNGLRKKYNPHQSSRQYMDSALGYRRDNRSRYVEPGDNVVTILDEPEAGLSPRRQMTELRDIVLGDTGEGAIGIVPTNCVSLFMDESLPRIDLDFPEKGVHYPDRAELEAVVAAMETGSPKDTQSARAAGTTALSSTVS